MAANFTEGGPFAAWVDGITSKGALHTGIVGLGLILALYLGTKACEPQIDPREPPRLQPRIPLIGHIIGLLVEGNDFFKDVQKKNTLPIATLPMLNGKIYSISSPAMVQSAMRNKHLGFDHFVLDATEFIFGLNKKSMALFRMDGSTLLPALHHAIKSSLTGPPMHLMNLNAIRRLTHDINDIGEDGLDVPDLFIWVRDLFTLATAAGLYGKENPIEEDHSLVDALWAFDENYVALMMNVLPSILGRKALRNRTKIQKALAVYYKNKCDLKDDVGGLIKTRAKVHRDHGIPHDEIAKLEMAMVFAASTNSAPATFWLLTFILLNPQLLESVREEFFNAIEFSDAEDGRRRALIDITKLEVQCPHFASAFRESNRLSNQGVGTRKVTEDTHLTDENGNTYLLKKGVDVFWSVTAVHHNVDSWGENVQAFQSDRFVEGGTKSPEVLKKQRGAYIPFGGGKHLCPGRNFATAEIMAFVGAMALGFEIDGLKKENVNMRSAKPGEAVVGPTKDGTGGAVKVNRRKGWENVLWEYTTPYS